MKFLALKDALDKALPPKPPEQPAKSEKPEVPQIAFFSPAAKKQTVVGGDIRRTPVNRQSALIIAKAPWWAKPPENPVGLPVVPAQPIKAPKNYASKKRIMHKPEPRRKPMSTAKELESTGEDIVKLAEKIKQSERINAELTAELHSKAGVAVKEAEDLVKKAMDARQSLDIMCDMWNKNWNEFMNTGDVRLKSLREFRMAFDSETRHLMAALRDVRLFFLDKDHDAEVAKLKEFVELCERLQKLKTSGFLDTMADTILKLS